MKGPLSAVPSPQIEPVLVQAGGSPAGIQTSAQFVELAFGFGGSVAAQQKYRESLDAAVAAAGRDPLSVGVLWATQLIVGRTAAEADERRRSVLSFWNEEAVGAHISHNAGFDFSTLPARFHLGDLADRIRAAEASPGGLVGMLVSELGPDHTMTRAEFFEHGWRHATGMDHTLVGSAEQVADALEENFAATGARGGYMLSSPLATPSGLADIAELLLPELRRRGALAPRYPGRTLRENLRG